MTPLHMISDDHDAEYLREWAAWSEQLDHDIRLTDDLDIMERDDRHPLRIGGVSL